MSKRIKWIFTSTISSEGLKGAVRNALAFPFSEGSAKGFLIDESRSDHFSGRFIERFEIQESIETPLGEKLTQTRVFYQTTKFVVRIDAPQLALYDPPRSNSAFVSALSELFDGLYLRSDLVDLRAFVEGLQNYVDEVKVTGVTAKHVLVGNGTTANISLKSQNGALQELDDFVGERTHTINTVGLATQIEHAVHLFSLSNRGRAAFSSTPSEELEASIHKALKGCVISVIQ